LKNTEGATTIPFGSTLKRVEAHNNQKIGEKMPRYDYTEFVGKIFGTLQVIEIDNNKGYWKDNLRLATYEEQLQNRRTNIVNSEIVKNIRDDFENNLMNVTQLSKKYNISTQHISRITLKKVWKNI
jgi:hypothetical protein